MCKRCKTSIGLALLALLANLTSQQTLWAQSDPHSRIKTSLPCMFDPEIGEVANCIRQTSPGQMFVSPQVLKGLQFDSYALAPIFSRSTGWMYVNRTGKVLIRGVPTFDNGPDAFHDGLVRVVRSGKYGFANRSGRLVIPAIYDGAMNFENGQAIVCKGCKETSAPGDPEHHSFLAGGEWFRINNKGKVIEKIEPEN